MPTASSKPVHREAASFVVRIELVAEFDEDYEGDDDGNAWLERWRAAVQPRLVRAVFEQLRSDPSFDAMPATRGRNPDDEMEITVRFKPAVPGEARGPRGARADRSP